MPDLTSRKNSNNEYNYNNIKYYEDNILLVILKLPTTEARYLYQENYNAKKLRTTRN